MVVKDLRETLARCGVKVAVRHSGEVTSQRERSCLNSEGPGGEQRCSVSAPDSISRMSLICSSLCSLRSEELWRCWPAAFLLTGLDSSV